MKLLLAAILVIAAIVFMVYRPQQETPLPRDATMSPSPEADDAIGDAPDVDSVDSADVASPPASAGQGVDEEEIDPHTYIEDPPQLSVSLPVVPLSESGSERQVGSSAETPPVGAGTAAGVGPDGAAKPTGGTAQGPVAVEDAGAPPEQGGRQALGPGPGGESSGMTDIEPVALGPEMDPTATLEPNADLGPPPEASDPGTMGPAPEDSGEE